jgi:SAM-dependent methyltransferase
MVREAGGPRVLPRTPEPDAAMNDALSVAGFDAQGAAGLLPIYDFNARAISALVPRGARIVDLGSGTGRFLGYLAVHRPDLEIVGLDFSEEMVRVGRHALRRAGVDDRVRLMHGDMREFRKVVPAEADLVSSVFSLHHLTTREDLLACLREIAAALAGRGSPLWIFDHVRPRRRRTAEEVPEIFTPRASRAFRDDSCNSLCASWSFEELRAALRDVFPVDVNGAKSRLLPLYQAHWTMMNAAGCAGAWVGGEDLPARARRQARLLSRLFQATPNRLCLENAASRRREILHPGAAGSPVLATAVN